MQDFSSQLPSNSEAEEVRKKELELQLGVLYRQWGTSIEAKLTRLGEPSKITVERAKEIKKGPNKGQEEMEYLDITARGLAVRYSVLPDPKKSAEERKREFKDKGFLQVNPYIKKKLDQFRYYPYTDQITRDFSAFSLEGDTEGRIAINKLVLRHRDTLLVWFNLVHQLKVEEEQTKYFFENCGLEAFLPELQASFSHLRTYWDIQSKIARANNHAQNVLGIGASARKKDLAQLEEVDIDALIKQVNDREDLDLEKRIELLEKIFQWKVGKLGIIAGYAEVEANNTTVIRSFEEPIAKEFRKSMGESSNLILENRMREKEVQERIKEVVNE